MDKLSSLLKINRTGVKYTKWLMKYTKPYLLVIIIILSLNTIETVASVYTAIVSKNLIDGVIAGSFDSKYIVIYASIILGSILIKIVTGYMSLMLYEKYSFGLRRQLYSKIITSKWIESAKYHTGDFMTRLTSDVRHLTNGIIKTLPKVIRLIIQLVISFAVLFYYEPMIAYFALLLGPTGAVIALILGRIQKRLKTRVQETEASYRAFLQESLANVPIIKSFTMEEGSLKKLVRLREERFFWVKKNAKVKLASSALMGLTFQTGYLIAFTIGALQVAKGDITFGTMTVFLTLVNRVQSPVMQLGGSVPKFVSMLASASRIVELQKLSNESHSHKQLKGRKIGLKLKNISFSYIEDAKIFMNSDVEINPGDFVAVMGESGIGKTTLIRLLLSFVDQSQGSIEFEDEYMESVHNSATMRGIISYVPQGNTLFSGSIMDNIRVGNTMSTELDIHKAINASACEFVYDLPAGLDTMIGEKGHGLSEGQAQRIGIARALLKEAPVVIFDEATSALDELTERKVMQNLQNIYPRPTCLIITHKRNLMDYCNKELKISERSLIMNSL